MYVTGPDVVKAVTNEQVTHEELGGATVHTEKSGVSCGAFDDEIQGLARLREFFDYLPLSNKVESHNRKQPLYFRSDNLCKALDNYM